MKMGFQGRKLVRLFGVSCMVLVAAGCGKEESSESGSNSTTESYNLTLPKLSKSTAAASFAATDADMEAAMMTSGTNIANNMGGTGLDSNLAGVFRVASRAFEHLKSLDQKLCYVQSLTAGGLVAHDNTYAYFTYPDNDGADLVKVRVKLQGTETSTDSATGKMTVQVDSFEESVCRSASGAAATQERFLSATFGSSTTVLAKQTDAQEKSRLDVTGVHSGLGSTWTSKTAVLAVDETTGYDILVTLQQEAAKLTFKGIRRTSVGSTDVRGCSMMDFSGSKFSTGAEGYSTGAGSYKDGGNSFSHFTAAGANTGSASSHSSGLTSMTNYSTTDLDAAIATGNVAFTSSEQWDCTVPSDAVTIDFSAVDTAVSDAYTACLNDLD